MEICQGIRNDSVDGIIEEYRQESTSLSDTRENVKEAEFMIIHADFSVSGKIIGFD